MSVITFRYSDKSRTIVAYALLLLFCIVTYVVSNILYDAGDQIRVFGWDALAVIVAGFILIGFQEEAGFPELLQRNKASRFRFILPLIWGLCFGIADVLVWKVILHPEPYDKLPPFLQPFPYSILLYFAGAVYMEVFIRLIPLTAVMLLVKRFARPGSHQPILIFLFVLTALYEPFEQLPTGSAWLVAYSFLTAFAMNFLQAWLYGRYGFLASLCVRLGHYLVWHIALGIYVEALELPG